MKEGTPRPTLKDLRRQDNLNHAQGRVHGTVFLEGKPRTNHEITLFRKRHPIVKK